MKIEVAGPGCFRCVETEKNVNEALKQLGINAEVTHIHDMSEITKRGVMFTPAVIVDGQIKISGKIPTVEEIKKILSSDK
ncbi:thioredoxin family protein [bacterium]|nr:thioredoxin family protein [bacterium]